MRLKSIKIKEPYLISLLSRLSFFKFLSPLNVVAPMSLTFPSEILKSTSADIPSKIPGGMKLMRLFSMAKIFNCVRAWRLGGTLVNQLLVMYSSSRDWAIKPSKVPSLMSWQKMMKIFQVSTYLTQKIKEITVKI